MSKQDRQGVRTPADLERKYDLGKLNQNERELAAQLEQMNTMNQSMQQFISDTNGTLAALDSSIEASEQAITSINGSISSIQNQVNNLNFATPESVYNLDVRLTQAEDDIEVLEENVTALDKRIDGITPYDPSVVEELGERVTTAEQDIVTLETKLTTAEGDITALEGNVETLSGKVTGAEGDISALEQNVSGLGSRLTTAEGDITALEQSVSVLEDDTIILDPSLYSGVNLSTKFATEISNYSSVWAWIKARITANNFAGIRLGDYIPFTANGYTLNAQVAGLDTYFNYGDAAIGHHIDFICKELWPVSKAMNPTKNNNGISGNEFPWLASDLYKFINSSGDYTAGGIYSYLPAALKAVIVEKRMLLEKRYKAGEQLICGNDWGWANIGKLWCPTEAEVYGMPVWGNFGFATGGSAVQYPIFQGNMNRVKTKNGTRGNWWLLTPSLGSSEYWCAVHFCGYATDYDTTEEFNAPVCFRIA